MAIPEPISFVWNLICLALGGSPWPKVLPDDLLPLAGRYGDRATRADELAQAARLASATLQAAAPGSAAGAALAQQALVMADSLIAAGQISASQQQSLNASADQIEDSEW